MKRVLAIAALALIAASIPAAAHHTLAGYIQTRADVLIGKVKEFQWTNPHSWIQVNVPGAGGKVVEWSIEGGSPNGLARKGWKSTSLKPGDKITAVINPMKDGSNGGSLKSVTTPDGKTLS